MTREQLEPVARALASHYIKLVRKATSPDPLKEFTSTEIGLFYDEAEAAITAWQESQKDELTELREIVNGGRLFEFDEGRIEVLILGYVDRPQAIRAFGKSGGIHRERDVPIDYATVEDAYRALKSKESS